MRFKTQLLILGLLFPGLSHAVVHCKTMVGKETIELKAPAINKLIEKPLERLNKKFVEKSDKRYGTPFSVILKEKLPEHLQVAVDDLHILSENDNVRARIFGSSKLNREYQTELRAEPLALKAQGHESSAGFFVETGVDVFTLDNGKRLYIYITSNSKNSIDQSYAFWSEIIAQIKSTGRKVVALDSFHSHPLNFLPSVMDQIYFTGELKLVKEAHPEIDFSNWFMRTTMESEPVLHEVELLDWVSGK